MDEGQNNVFTRQAERYARLHEDTLRAGLTELTVQLPLIREVGEPVWTATPEWGHLASYGRNAPKGYHDRAVLAGIDAFFAAFSADTAEYRYVASVSLDFRAPGIESVILAAILATIADRFQG